MINYDREDCIIPEIYRVGKGIYNEHTCFKPQVHRNTYEICYMIKGNWDWWADNQVFELQPGQIYMTKPGEVHGGLNDTIYPSEFYWLQVKFPQKGCLPFMNQQEYDLIADTFKSMDKKVFQGIPEVPFYFKKILEEHKSPNPYSRIIVSSNLANLIIAVIKSYNSCDSQKNLAISSIIQNAVTYIKKNIEYNPKVEDVAEKLGISITSLNHKFHEEIGDSPKHYIIQQRIHYAKLLLSDQNSSITEIAHRLGFSSSQYFATLFKQACGFSPKDYKDKVNLSVSKMEIQDQTQE